MAMTKAEQEAYRAERDKVDAFYAKGQVEQKGSAKQTPKQKKYPAMVSLLGQGFRNLYDALGGND